MNKINELPIKPAKILLPKNADYTKWATVACDQFTSSPEYWQKLETFVGNEKSTLRLVLAEIYLNDNAENRIEKINENIKEYLDEGVFNELEEGFILINRRTEFRESRLGLICCVDLEKYEYGKKTSAMIRSTEGTIEERIPPRLKIRENAQIELPHIMVLYDDEKREITEELSKNKKKYKKLYDFDLNMKGGSIEGYFIDDVNFVLEKFEGLADSGRLTEKYGSDEPFLFAVGDGNHSLATAKAHWNKLKTSIPENERENHPARFALVELVNIYDDGIYFEPIYRYVTGISSEKFIKGFPMSVNCKIYANGKTKDFNCNEALPNSISETDEYIKEFLLKNGGNVDYIHGDAEIRKLVDENPDSVGILFEKLDKSDLFKFVSAYGALPRKTFSMGEGTEKRYYLEARKIVH